MSSSDWSVLEAAALVDEGLYISAERSLGNHQSAEALKQVRSQITSPPMGAHPSVLSTPPMCPVVNVTFFLFSFVWELPPVPVQCGLTASDWHTACWFSPLK